MAAEKPTRQHPRARIDADFWIRDVDDSHAGELAFVAHDLSPGGAFLRSDFLLEVGERLEVRFALPDARQALVLRARVAWVTHGTSAGERAGMGLEFVDPSPEEGERLARFVRAQLQHPSLHKPTV